MSKKDLAEFGALDQLNCLWYIPPGVKFVWARRDIAGIENIEIGVKGQERGDIVSHGGGTVFFLREDSRESANDVPSHWPFVFIAPSFVTLSKHDIAELKMDNDDAPAQSAEWPKVDDCIKCPVCRKQAEADDVTVYVLVGTQGLRMGKSAQVAAKLLWRVFCTPCFDSLGARDLYIPMEGFGVTDMPTSVLPFLKQGLAAPFSSMGFFVTPGNHYSPPGNTAVPCYQRIQSFIRSGFHYCLSNDYNRYLTLMMGGSKTKTDSSGGGQTASFSSKWNLDKLAVKCCAVGCLNTEAQDGESNTPGEKKIKNLLVCSKCRVAKYCSKECQLAAWKAGHKKECKELQKMNATTAAGGSESA